MTAPLPPTPTERTRRLFVRDLLVEAEIGVHAHETGRRQRVRLNLDLDVDETGSLVADDIDSVVSYEPLVEAARALAAAGHTKLVETLAERLAAQCLRDPRVRLVRVRVEKLDVFPDAASVGVEIERGQPGRTPP
ncbi:MAG: dihydroneopterin aldolase [Inquilinaceae bacterium]